MRLSSRMNESMKVKKKIGKIYPEEEL